MRGRLGAEGGIQKEEIAFKVEKTCGDLCCQCLRKVAVTPSVRLCGCLSQTAPENSNLTLPSRFCSQMGPKKGKVSICVLKSVDGLDTASDRQHAAARRKNESRSAPLGKKLKQNAARVHGHMQGSTSFTRKVWRHIHPRATPKCVCREAG